MANRPPRVEIVFDIASVGAATPLPLRRAKMLRCPGVSALAVAPTTPPPGLPLDVAVQVECGSKNFETKFSLYGT